MHISVPNLIYILKNQDKIHFLGLMTCTDVYVTRTVRTGPTKDQYFDMIRRTMVVTLPSMYSSNQFKFPCQRMSSSDIYQPWKTIIHHFMYNSFLIKQLILPMFHLKEEDHPRHTIFSHFLEGASLVVFLGMIDSKSTQVPLFLYLKVFCCHQ